MDWYDVLPFFQTNELNRIVSSIKEEKRAGKTVFPPNADILNAFVYTPLKQVKVVIFGQDPYHQANPQYACGLAFGIRPGTNPLPKSLINIFRELHDDIGVSRTDGDLSDWARQGILLLNTTLTVNSGEAGSHSQIGWRALIRDVIQAINEHRENVVFIFWGNHAQRLETYIDKSKHHIIKSAHPSPLSAHRGFFGSKPFSATNKYLQEHNISPIIW